MWTLPWLASLTSYRSRWQSGQVRSYVRPLGAALLAAGPYGVREIGSKSQWRARWPIVGYWFFRPRLVDRLPLPCPLFCLPSPVGTFPAHAHSGDRAVSPDDLISRLLRVPGLANASSLHGSDSQPYAAAETAFVTPRAL